MGLQVEKTHKSLGSICFYHRKKGGTTTTNNQQPATNSQQQPTNNSQQPTTNHQRPTTNNRVFCKTIFKYLLIYIYIYTTSPARPQLAPPHKASPATAAQLSGNSWRKFPGTVCCWASKWAKVCCFQTALPHSSVIDRIYNDDLNSNTKNDRRLGGGVYWDFDKVVQLIISLKELPHVDSVWVPTPPLTGQLIGLPDLNRSLPKWIQPGFARIPPQKRLFLTTCILHVK